MIDGLRDLCVTPVNDRSALGHTCNQRYLWHRQDSSALLDCGSDASRRDRADVDRATVGDSDGEVALTWEAAAALDAPAIRKRKAADTRREDLELEPVASWTLAIALLDNECAAVGNAQSRMVEAASHERH